MFIKSVMMEVLIKLNEKNNLFIITTTYFYKL